MRNHKRLFFALLATFALQSSTAWAGDFDGGHRPMSYVGSAFANVLYFPAKVGFAAVGAVTTGVVYVATLFEKQPANEIWTASVEGDYIVTPSMIEGHEDVDFIGG